VQRPSDLGFSDDGYTLPDLQRHWHELPSDHATAGAEKDGQGKMFRSAAIGLQDAAREKRDSLPARVAKVQELARGHDDQRIVWCDLNDEQRGIEKALEAEGLTVLVPLRRAAHRRARDLLKAWKERETDAFVSKPVMYGAGVNLQQCHTMIFAGVGYKFARRHPGGAPYPALRPAARLRRALDLHGGRARDSPRVRTQVEAARRDRRAHDRDHP
jgi:hypothetical protein